VFIDDIEFSQIVSKKEDQLLNGNNIEFRQTERESEIF
jgi:hypothetical protein